MEVNEKKEVVDRTGVTTPTNGMSGISCIKEVQKGKEEDIVSALLSAADFRNDEELITPIEIKRNGKKLFSFNVRPVSDEEVAFVRKKTRKMYPNPAGKKYPKIEGEIDAPQFNSRLIYIATVEDDRERVWGQRAVMDKFNLVEPWETIGVVLTAGEKSRVADVVMEISGMQDDEADNEETLDSIEDYAKN